VAFPRRALQRDKRSLEMTFVVVKDTLQYFAMMC
jgi:hypothetical protein